MEYKKLFSPGYWSVQFDDSGSFINSYFDDYLKNTLGIISDADFEYEHFINSLVHPDDKARTEAYISRFLQKDNIQDGFDTEFRVQTERGYRWFHLNGHSRRFENGLVERIDGCAFDFNDNVENNSKIQKYEMLFNSTDIRMYEDAMMISGLASEYTALYYVNLDDGSYIPYHLSNEISDIKAYISKCPLFTDLVRAFAYSSLVHPDFGDYIVSYFPSFEHVKNELKDKKKISFSFKRNYGGTYLWTEADIVKCEDVNDEAHSVVVGFAENNKEVLEQQKQEGIKRKAEESQKLIDNYVSSFDFVFIVNMETDSLEIKKAKNETFYKEHSFVNFASAKKFTIEHLIHPCDRNRISHEFDYNTIKQRLSVELSYTIEYCSLKNDVVSWGEVTVTAVGDDRVIVGMTDKDTELIRRHIADRRYDEYFALYIIDCYSETIRELKNTTNSFKYGLDRAYPYRERMLGFAGTIDDEETKRFFLQLSEMEYIKTALITEDKLSYSYKSNVTDGWVDMIGFVLKRNADGTPSIVSLGFSFADSRRAEKKEMQVQLNQDMQMISGLAEEYTALFYVNMDQAKYKVFSLNRNKMNSSIGFLAESADGLDILVKYGHSKLIHPDDRHLFDNFNNTTVREHLAHSKRYSTRYRRKVDGEFLWYEMDIIKYEDIDERANVIAIGFANRDNEIRGGQVLDSCLTILGKEITPDKSINELLAVLGEYYAPERIYIYEYSKQKADFINTYYWTSFYESTVPSIVKKISASDIEDIVSRFRKKGACYYDYVDNEIFTEKTIQNFRDRGINNYIAAPIMKGDEIIGFIGIENPFKAKKDLGVAKTAAAIAYSVILKRNEDDEEHVTLGKLAETFNSVYYVDLTRDYVHTWKVDKDYNDAYGQIEHYSDSIGDYVRNCIALRDRKRCIKKTSPDFVLKQFKTKERFSIDMTDIMLGYERNFVFDYVKLNDEGTKMVICCKDVTESLQKEREQQEMLQEALRMATYANKSKTSFLFNMSHDIRTPLNAITGFTNMAIKHIDDKEKALDCLIKTQQSGNMLLSLINSVLEVSRIESGKAVLEEKPGDIFNSFSNIESTMHELAEAKEIELTFTFDKITDRFVLWDINRCIRIFVNVISNAIKYTREGGFVHVNCVQLEPARDGKAVYSYSIEDNGIGMSEEFQKHVFEQFSREKNSTVSGIQGTGLGMAVCKSFVDLMGGTIECKSEQGVGTLFTINIPFILQPEDIINESASEAASENTDNGIPDKYDLSGKHVLLVEDNELNREIAVEMLEEEGIIVEEADDGLKAVDLMKQNGPDFYDFILMDIQMPIMGGYEATRIIRELYPSASIPIIALSANAFAEDKAASISAGMDAHVAKPIDNKELFRVLSKYI